MHSKSMTSGAPWKHVLSFSLPVLTGSLLQQLYNTADAIIVGRFCGEDSLSAVGTTGSLVFFFLAIAIGFSAGVGVVIAQFFGARQEEKVRAAASSGIILLAILGIIATILSWLTARVAAVQLLDVDDSIVDLTVSYFRWYALAMLFQYGYNIVASILRAIGDSAASLYFLMVSTVLNIGLDLLFVAWFHWGVVGAAVATVIAQAGCYVVAHRYLTRKYPIFRFTWRQLTWDPTLAKSALKVGMPIALQLVIVSFGLTFIQRAANGFGKAMTASFTVGQRIEMYLNLPGNAFQTTMATFAAQNIGAGQLQRVRVGVWQTFAICLTMVLIISACVTLFADQIVVLFGLGEQASTYCHAHLRAIALANIILSLYIPLFGVFQASNHSSVPMIVALSALTVRNLVTYAFRHSPFLGYSVVWWNSVFGYSLGLIIAWSYYLSGRWQRNSSFATHRHSVHTALCEQEEKAPAQNTTQ